MTEITQLGRYQVLGKLAVGGMAEVFLARQEGPAGFTKTAVIKQILPSLAEDRKLVGMFLNEARLAALITHPNVAQIFELGGVDEGQTPWLAMEWVDGKSLARVLKAAHERGESLPVAVAAAIVAEACAGLEAAHSLADASGRHLGLVHRDVSPENILVSFQGHVKLVDFGVAKAMAADPTRTATLRGKFAYLSPEQVLGEEIDSRSDLFGIGVVLYRSLSGWLPFRGKTEFEVMKKIVSDLPVPLGPHVPFALARIVDRCLVKSREARYGSAREVQVDLQAFLAQQGGAGSLEIGAYLATLHPPQSDPDRIRVQRILAGEALADPAGPVAVVPADAPSGNFALQEMQESPSDQPPPLPTAFDPSFVSVPIRRPEGPAAGVIVEEQQEVMVVTTGELLAITAPIGERPGAPAADPLAAALAGSAPMPEPAQPAPRPASGSRQAAAPRPASGPAQALPPRQPTGRTAVPPPPAEEAQLPPEPQSRPAQPRDEHGLPLPPLPPEPRSSRSWIWGVAAVMVLGLGLGAFALRGPLGLLPHRGPPIPEGAATGELRIEVTAGAHVRIDGVELGIAPVESVELAEGLHEVVIVHPLSGNEKSFSVNVPAGAEKTFKVKLDP